ncbi:MAG: HAMP domain-containing histidine kinase [Chloroflexi bacterium]|nr:HAMP domain-containing histidine kinase [Chloroflexota bacterium]
MHRRRGKFQKRHRHGPRRPKHFGKRGRFIFLRFATMFGMMALLVAGGMLALAMLVTRLVDGSGRTAVLVWVGGCGFSVALPMLASVIAMRAWRNIALPLADVMTAADAMASGDLSVRVSEQRPGEFRPLAKSFNRMAGELEQAEQRRRNLTADVAHELRTPLHIIQGNLEGILDGVYEPSEDHINDTLDETRLLARLVEDLRILSLAEAGQLPLVKEPVDVIELLTDVQTSFSGQAAATGIELRVVNMGVYDTTINGDIDRLDQVLSNLVANALRYTGSNGEILLTAAKSEDGICLQVKDNGAGIDPEVLPYIFDRFWRGNKARTHKDGSGSGLGLAIAKQLVVAHNGRISVESTLGEGTTFTIELPDSVGSEQ